MSDPINVGNFTGRLIAGYRHDIEQLERDQAQTVDPKKLEQIRLMLNAKRWHLARHLADAAAAA